MVSGAGGRECVKARENEAQRERLEWKGANDSQVHARRQQHVRGHLLHFFWGVGIMRWYSALDREIRSLEGGGEGNL